MLNYALNGINHNEIGAYAYMLQESNLQAVIGDIKCIFELGARTAEDSIALADIFKCQVHAFEPNPIALEFCREHLKGRTDIILNANAVANFNGKVDFYAVDTSAYPNVGASSLYQFNLDPQIQPPEVMRAGDKIQYKIDVDCIRLSDYCDTHNVLPDAIFMDIQGAELDALKGLGDKLKNVKLIAMETQYHSGYIGAPTWFDIDPFLKENGFKFAWCWQTHANKLPDIPNPPREAWWDMIYIRA